MSVIDVVLEVIDDNPYNPRKHYPQAKVKEMAQSLREVGLRQVPEGRHVDGRCQLAYGHMRKRGYLYNQRQDPENWLWEKISAGTPAIARNREDLFKRIDKLTDEELARLVVEFMFYYLTDKGDIGSYEIKATEPLKWMGIDIKMEDA